MAKRSTLRQEIMKFYTVRRFDGGLNDEFSNEMVADNQATDILNWDLTTRGSIKVRSGYSKLNSLCLPNSAAAMPIRGLHCHYDTDGTTSYWYAACSGLVYRNINSYISAYLNTTFTVDADFGFESYKNQVFICNGVDTSIRHVVSAGVTSVNSWNPASVGAIDIIKLWQEQLWIVPSNSAWMLRYPVSAGNTTTYNAADYIAVGRQDGGLIKACEVLHGNFVILKDTGIYVLAGTHPDDYQLDLMTRNGCVSKRSVVVGDNGIIYLAPDGVRLFDGMHSILLSETPEYWIDIVGAMNANVISKTAAAYFDRKYILAYDVAGGTNDNSYAFVYNFLTGTWTKYQIPANVFVKTKGTDEAYDLYFGASTSGYVYKMYSGTDDDGVAIEATYKTKGYDFTGQYRDLAGVEKQFRKLIVQGTMDTGELKIEAGVDGGNVYTGHSTAQTEASNSYWANTSGFSTVEPTFIWDESNWSTDTNRFSHETDFSVKAAGKALTLTMTANSLGQTVEVDLLKLGFREKRVRG